MTSSRKPFKKFGRALITGASSGIGAEFARQLAAAGSDLVLVARDVARLEATAKLLHEKYNITVEVLPADLSIRQDVLKVAKRLEDNDSPIDLLINNAGFGIPGILVDIDIATHEKALDVMCLAILILGSSAAKTMRARGHGRIINVSSATNWIFTGNYSAIKAWVYNYSLSLGIELKNTGVSVTTLCPGFVKTEHHKRAGIKSSNIPGPVWIKVQDVVRTGLLDAYHGKPVSLITLRWKFAINVLAQRGPRAGVRWFSGLLNASRRK